MRERHEESLVLEDLEKILVCESRDTATDKSFEETRSLSDWELKVSIIPARCFHKTAAMGPFVSVES